MAIIMVIKIVLLQEYKRKEVNRMKSFGRYMILENKEDLEKECRYTDYLERYYYGGGYFKAPETFPACYKYIDSFDSHFCGDWNKCNEDEAFAYWDEWVNKYIKFVADAKELFRK